LSLIHGATRRAHRAVAAVLLLALVATLVLLSGGVARAAPVLSVSKSAGSALLGGQATMRITVTNTGDVKGYCLSLRDVFTSDPLRIDGKNKTVSFVSASTPDGPLTPTFVTTDPVTNALTVGIDDIMDIGLNESIVITIVVSPTDTDWAVGDKMHDEVTAEVNTQPDGSGTAIQGTASGDSNVLPIEMYYKAASQSTADDQATGCGELIGGRWPYSYTIMVRNNLVNQTDNVVVTDVIPDGIEYLGVTSGPAPDSATRSDNSGQWTLTWNVGPLAAAQNWTVTYAAGIRYDYYGTANGGTNRAYNDYTGAPGTLGTPVPDQVALTNSAVMNCFYLGTPYSDGRNATVTAAYGTVHKSVNPSSAYNGETVHFALTYSVSEYYDTSDLVVVDVLPDGLTYTVGSAVPAPDIIENDTPGLGQTTLTWNTLAAPNAGGQAVITFDATVDSTWSVPPDPNHLWIVAGDRMTNNVTTNANWSDTLQARTGNISDESSSSVVAVGPSPSITKEEALDDGGVPGAYSHSINASVGDTIWFRVRMNTSDGASPITSTTQFGNVDVVDWIPQGTQYVAGSRYHQAP